MSAARPNGLYTRRLEVGLDLRLAAPLHIGTATARARENPDPRRRPDEPEAFEVAELLRDVDRAPVIPGSTLKGLLREVGDKEDVQLLLGEVATEPDDASRMGLLSVQAATAVGWTPPAEDRPRRRTALDPVTGAAATHKLYAHDEVPARTRFRLALTLLRATDASRAALVRLLAKLAVAGDRGLGRGRADGMGRFALDLGSFEATRFALAEQPGGWAWRGEADQALATELHAAVAALGSKASRTVCLTLTCEGPYLSRDPWEVGRDGQERNRIVAARDGGLPDLLTTSLAGALRQRAAWLWWLENLGATEADARDTPLRRRWLEARARGEVPEDSAERDMIAQLRPVERLFGITGWRGLLRLREVRCTDHEGWITLDSVALDRHSMAPLHGALFSIEASLRPSFEAVVEIESRAGMPSANDEALLGRLWRDLEAEGLMLGYGTSRGFGWFAVRVEHPPEEPSDG
jgi:CRISPR/Cas system CSM-associated protein Csm3 (group 7 of RAMP superfamily)